MATSTTTRCSRCERPAPRLVLAYWGEALCPDCCQAAVAAHDLMGSWPPMPPASDHSGTAAT